MGLFFIDSDFNGPFNDAPSDPYYADIGTGYFDPFFLYVLLALAITVVIAVSIGAYIGRRQAAMRLEETKRRSVDHIYNSIRYRLDQALEARGLAIIERAALVREDVHNRLGQVMALADSPGKSLAALEKALPAPTPPKPEAAKPHRIKVAMSAEEQMIAVWEGLNAFRLFWSQEDHIKGLIRAAQDELARTDNLAYVRQLEAQYLPPPELVRWRPVWLRADKRGVETLVTAALNDADKVGAVAVVAASPDPDRTPPPVAPKPVRKKLPAHKRNMLA